MNFQDHRTLRILEEFEKNQITSQRQLAGKLRFSLGLLNAYLQSMARRGLIQTSSLTQNRNQYVLTAAGAAEQNRLYQEYVKDLLVTYEKVRNKFISFFNHLEQNGDRTIGFFGTGLLAEIAYVSLLQTSMELVAVIDYHGHSDTDFFFDTPIVALQEVENYRFDGILVTTPDPEISLTKQLVDAGIKKNRIHFLST